MKIRKKINKKGQVKEKIAEKTIEQKDYDLKRKHVVNVLTKGGALPTSYEIIAPCIDAKNKQQLNTVLSCIVIRVRKASGISQETSLSRIQNIFSENNWDYQLSLDEKVISLNHNTITTPPSQPRLRHRNNKVIIPVSIPHSTPLESMISCHDNIFNLLIELHKKLGILGVQNRDQDLRKLGKVSFNYFNNYEMGKALSFFQEHLPGFAAKRSDKPVNITFTLNNVTENSLINVMSNQKYYHITFRGLEVLERIEVIKWALRKHSRDNTLSQQVSMAQNNHTTTRITLGSNYCSSVKMVLTHLNIAFFEEIFVGFHSVKDCSIVISLTSEFDEFLADKKTKKSCPLYDIVKQFNVFLVNQEIKAIPKKRQNFSGIGDRKSQPSSLILTQYHSKSLGILGGYETIRRYTTDDMIVIRTKSLTAKEIFLNIVNNKKIGLDSFILQHTSYDNVFFISKSWKVFAAHFKIPIGTLILY